MRHPALDKLLVLQDRDSKRLNLEAQLKATPRDIAVVEQKIASEKAAIDNARNEVKELEVKKKSLETEIGTVGSEIPNPAAVGKEERRISSARQ